MSDICTNVYKFNDKTIVNKHLCRICFTVNDLLVPLHEEEGIKLKLAEKIQKYLPIKVLPSDNLPQNVCYPCVNTIISWDSLFNVFLKTNEIFQSLLKEETVVQSFSIEKVKTLRRKKNQIKSRDKKVKTKKPNTKEKPKMNVEAIKDDTEECLKAIKTEINAENADESMENIKKDADVIKCEVCKKGYKVKKCLEKHFKQCHEDGNEPEGKQCELCSNTYKTEANLERHYLKEHFTNQVQCPVCHGTFNSKKLEWHLKSAHGVKTVNKSEPKFKCKLCVKKFKNKYARNSHMKEVHLSEQLKCKLCDFEGVGAVLRRHKRDVHGEKKHMCSLCPAAFKTVHTLKMHMTSHSDIRCYTCDICGMGFKRLNNVRDHMKCHEEKSNQCQICGKFFARKRYLAIHEKTIHNFYADGEVPEENGFDCEICGAKLKWKKNLLAHMRIHTGEKPYVCKICNKDFACHGSLRTHMSKHSVCASNEVKSNQVHIFNSNVQTVPAYTKSTDFSALNFTQIHKDNSQ